MSAKIYADYAASTPMDQRVIEAMRPFWTETFGNPSSLHSFGVEALGAVETAREEIGRFLNCQATEIYFTSSGTESNNLALLGVAKANRSIGKHIVTSAVEHPSIRNACSALERDGFEITYVNPGSDGIISPLELAKSVRKDTILVSIHWANSEIGVVQDIASLSKAVKSKNRRVLFHTDACQAAAWLEMDPGKLPIDLLSFNGSKIYGPKGIAVLYVKNGTDIFPIIYGGGQEKSLRSGTENVPGIIGLAKAAKLIAQDRSKHCQRVESLRNKIENELRGQVRANFATAPRLPNYLSLTLDSTAETDLVAALNRKGVAVSSGSACSSREMLASYVLISLGLTSTEVNQTIRVSLGRPTTAAEAELIASAILALVK